MTAQVIENELTLHIHNDIAQISNTIQGMLSFAQELEVTTSEAFKNATQLWKQAREWRKAIDAQRKEATEADRKRIAAVNDRAKELTDPLSQVEEIVKHKADFYQKFLERQREDQINKQKEAAEMLGVDFDIYVPPIEKSLRGEGAIAYTKSEKKFRVTDISKVPTKYLLVDTKSVENDIKLGIAEIPGLEIYTEDKVVLRSR